MTSTTPALPETSNKSTFSCVRCADRKVKCDRQTPCSGCIRHNAQCVFRPPRPPRRRRKVAVDEDVNSKLRHYETLLTDHGIDPQNLPKNIAASDGSTNNETRLDVPVTDASYHSDAVPKARLLHSQERSRLVDNVLWTRVIEEHHDPGEALDESVYDATDSATSDLDFGFVLGPQSCRNSTPEHPPAEDILTLWQIFINNVDPVLKVVHIPTLDEAIRKAAHNIQNLPKSFESLLFSIYSAAVMALQDDECQRKFGFPRNRLLARYIKATRNALVKANFMGTSSVVVLQALTLHILTLRDLSEPLPIWTLIGATLRIAESMGLNRNGESLGLPPFEAEIRRRLWWHLRMHDSRAAELCGMAKFRPMENEFSVNPPLNINDADLFPSMMELPPEKTGLTDVTFTVIRAELNNFAMTNVAVRGIRSKESMLFDHRPTESELEERDHIINQLEESLESKYLRYCDPSRPVELFVLLVTRFAMNITRFHMHHPRGWSHDMNIPDKEQRKIWDISLKLLEQCDMLQTSPQLRRFAWNTPYYLPWYALIHVLDTLRGNPNIAGAFRAWKLVESIYNSNQDLITNTRKTIHVAVGNLCLKAFVAQEKASTDVGQSAPRVPGFIRDLRQQRTIATAKRARRDGTASKLHVNGSADKTEPEEVQSLPLNITENHSEVPKVTRTLNSGAFGTANIPANTSNIPTSFESRGLFGPFEDVVADMDVDFILDHSPGDQEINWAQWDSWLKDVNTNATNTAANMSFDFGFTDVDNATGY